MIPQNLLSAAGQTEKMLCVFIEYEAFSKDPLLFSLFIHLLNGRQHVCYLISETQVDCQSTTKLFVTKGRNMKEFANMLGFTPDIWIC